MLSVCPLDRDKVWKYSKQPNQMSRLRYQTIKQTATKTNNANRHVFALALIPPKPTSKQAVFNTDPKLKLVSCLSLLIAKMKMQHKNKIYVVHIWKMHCLWTNVTLLCQS